MDKESWELSKQDAIYNQIKKIARDIVATFPKPDFYIEKVCACEISKFYYQTDPIVDQLKKFVSNTIDNDIGHGMDHVEKVALDAGAVILVESGLIKSGFTEDFFIEGKLTEKNFTKKNNNITFSGKNLYQILIMVQCASLLHDIKRKQKEHAKKGAEYAKSILKSYAFSSDEIEDISLAIYNHEAFTENIKIKTCSGNLIANSLYDADKFRWGPDNFLDTVWDMVSYSKIPLSEFMKHYPDGIKMLERIKNTFRTKTGKKYGPQFINTGIAIGKKLGDVIKTEFNY